MSDQAESGTIDRGLLIDVVGDEAHIVLARPARRNAISERDFVAIRAALQRFHADDAVRAIVLRSVVPNVFSAGADIGTLSDPDPAELQRQFTLLMECCDDMRTGKPVVAVVDGYCLGAGCAIVAAADFVVATEEAQFGLPELKLDLAPVLAFTTLFPVVDFRQLVYWAATGVRISAADARAAGLVTLVTRKGELESDLARLLADVKRPSSFALAQLKRAYGSLAYRLTRELRPDLYRLMLESARHPATQSAVAQFLHKRSGAEQGSRSSSNPPERVP